MSFVFGNIIIGGAIVSVLSSNVVDSGIKLRSGQIIDYAIDIYCFSVKHAALKSKRKYSLTRNLDNVSEWGDIYICSDCCVSDLVLSVFFFLVHSGHHQDLM